jgi:hypothetical protein
MCLKTSGRYFWLYLVLFETVGILELSDKKEEGDATISNHF